MVKPYARFISHPWYWRLEDTLLTPTFWRHLAAAMPQGSILYIEGVALAADAERLFKALAISPPYLVEANTFAPTPACFYLPLNQDTLDHLGRLANDGSEICDHIMVCRDDEILLYGHDVIYGEFLLAKSIGQAAAHGLAAGLKGKLQRLVP